MAVTMTNNNKEWVLYYIQMDLHFEQFVQKGKHTLRQSVLPSREALQTMIAVSIRNCSASCLRLLPSTFRTPTSLERLTACAVARFMKLTQAITIRKMPMSVSAVIRE